MGLNRRCQMCQQFCDSANEIVERRFNLKIDDSKVRKSSFDFLQWKERILSISVTVLMMHWWHHDAMAPAGG